MCLSNIHSPLVLYNDKMESITISSHSLPALSFHYFFPGAKMNFPIITLII